MTFLNKEVSFQDILYLLSKVPSNFSLIKFEFASNTVTIDKDKVKENNQEEDLQKKNKEIVDRKMKGKK